MSLGDDEDRRMPKTDHVSKGRVGEKLGVLN